MRERWKQADLEALALKNIHRQSISYLVSLDATEIRVRKADKGSVLALNGFILASDPEYDDLLKALKGYTIIMAPTEEAVKSSALITDPNVAGRYL